MTYVDSEPTSSRRGRTISSTLDQVMSSASNGLIVFAVARVATVDAFGIASLLFSICAASVGFMRGATGTPLMLISGRGQQEIRREAGFAVIAAIIFSIVVCSFALIAGTLLDSIAIGFAFATALVLILVQDVLRYAAISMAHPHVALLWDTIWAIGSATLLVVTWVWQTGLSETQVIYGWAFFAGLGAIGLMFTLRVVPRLVGIRSWWRVAAGSRIRFGIEAALEQINVIIIVLGATVIIGTAAAAVLRGASTVLSPLSILMSALPLVIIPESVRAGSSEQQVWGKLMKIGLLGSSASLFIGCAVIFVPASVGELFLGESWEPTKVVLPIIAFEYFCNAWLFVAMNFLKFRADSRGLLRARIVYGVVTIILCLVIGLITRSAVGVAIGLATSAAIMSTALVWYARPTTGKHQQKPTHSHAT